MLIILFLFTTVLACLTDSQCPTNKPYCNPDTSNCEVCYTDAHCKTNDQCNAVCNSNSNTCNLPFGQSPYICNTTQVCYEFQGKCLPKCDTDADCSLVPTVLHYPNTGVCDKTGKCYDCLVTSDCKPFRNETCNAQCSYNPKTLEYLCGNGNLCSTDKSCKLKTSTTYYCSGSNMLYMPYSLIFILLVLYL